MKKENPKFTGQVNNTFDVFRMIKAVKSPKVINNKERSFLLTILVMFVIAYLIGFFWIGIMIFNPGFLLD